MQNLQGKKALITGGLGMIGSNIARRLVDLGVEVTILDALIEPFGGNFFNIKDIEDKIRINIADIRDKEAIKVLVKDKDYIFNLAGQVSHNDSLKNPFLDADINYMGHLNVIEAAKRALDMGYSGYGPSLGLPELREAIKDFVNESYGTDIKKEEVMVTVGAKTAVFMGLIALIDQGDEVLIPDPGYPLYESAVLFAGGKPVFVKLREDEDYRMDPKMIEDAITSRTRVIILNYPENPAGSTLSKNDVLEIMEIAKRNNIVVFSDEIYDRYVYDGEHFSTLQYDEWRSNLYYVNGFSKTFAMTGWRLGYSIAPVELVEAMVKVQQASTTCAASFVQAAGIAALKGPQDCVQRMVEEYRERRDIITKGLNSIDGFECMKPKGAFYVFPSVEKLGRNSEELCERLLREAGVAAVPGSAFGPYGEGHVRFSYANSRDNIQRAIDRMREVEL